jgi:hypothetical protein
VAGLAALGAGIVAAEGGVSPTPATAVPAARLSSVATLGRLNSPGATGPLGPEGVPIPNAPQLAQPSAATPTSPVDGIRCLGSEQLLFHVHAHLTIYVNGAARRVPGGIGIVNPQVSQTAVGAYAGAGNCFYWLHTHAADGIIHIESPVKRTFTLGDFFDVWGQRLSGRQVGSATGPVTAIYNGRAYEGSPRDIPLAAHAQIQLEVGRPLVSPVNHLPHGTLGAHGSAPVTERGKPSEKAGGTSTCPGGAPAGEGLAAVRRGRRVSPCAPGAAGPDGAPGQARPSALRSG